MTRYLIMSLGAGTLALLLVAVGVAAEVAGAVGIGAALVGFLGAELFAGEATWRWRTVRNDVVHAALSAGTAQLALLAATLLLASIDRPRVDWPLLVQIPAIVVGSDLLGYWAHRAQHRVRLLWAGHALHHSPGELYWLNGLRAHPSDTLWAFGVSTLWALAAGFSTEAFVIASVVQTSHLLLQHTRVEFPRWLESVVVTPAWHAVHHDIDDGSTNLAHIFTTWDRAFGTFRPSLPHPGHPGARGLAPDTLRRELTLPFRILSRP